MGLNQPGTPLWLMDGLVDFPDTIVEGNQTNAGILGADLVPALAVAGTGTAGLTASASRAGVGMLFESRSYATVGRHLREALGLRGNPSVQMDHIWVHQNVGKWNACANLTPVPAWLNRLMGQAMNSRLNTAKQLKGILARFAFNGSYGGAAGLGFAAGYHHGDEIAESMKTKGCK